MQSCLCQLPRMEILITMLETVKVAGEKKVRNKILGDVIQELRRFPIFTHERLEVFDCDDTSDDEDIVMNPT